jgi:hypothetical protein
VVEKEQMKETSNLQPHRSASHGDAGGRPMLHLEPLTGATTSNIKHQKSYILWRVLDFVLAGVFIFAGVTKAIDPIQFASDIDNFKILPWPVSVALAFYLPWLEIFCAVGLVFRLLYRGALTLLITLMVVFTLAITAAKVRGLDITCGCFGHASQHWSFPSHLATNVVILAALLALSFSSRLRKPL